MDESSQDAPQQQPAPDVVQPVKRRGRPPGSKDKKKRKIDRRKRNRPTPPIATQFTKENPGLAVYKPGVGATTPNRYIAWREKMKTAKREWFTIARFRAFLDEAEQIALDRKDPARPEMLKYLIDQGIGKASSKLEVETTDNSMSAGDRVHLAMVAAGLIQNLQQQQLPMPVVTDLPVVEGEVIEECPQTPQPSSDPSPPPSPSSSPISNDTSPTEPGSS
jgi:hypothetical protein